MGCKTMKEKSTFVKLVDTTGFEENGQRLFYCWHNELNLEPLGTTDYDKKEEIKNEYCGCSD